MMLRRSTSQSNICANILRSVVIWPGSRQGQGLFLSSHFDACYRASVIKLEMNLCLNFAFVLSERAQQLEYSDLRG